MDGAKDCLASADEPPHESHNIVSRLAVKARSRLIQEQKRGFSDELDT